MSSLKHFPLAPAVLALLLAACATPEPPAPPAPQARADSLIIASIKAAGDKEKSIIDVNPLREPGVTSLQDGANADVLAGRYPDAAAKLDQAIKLSPDSPDLLQDRAEVAIRLHDYASAEKLAHHSWELGPRLGPLCARNWQTIVELRDRAGDQAGAASARKWVQKCHVEGVPRY